MPNRAEHQGIAPTFQAVVEVFRKPALHWRDRLPDLAGAAAGATFGGTLPDLLEPATSPNHRQFAHGVLPATAVACFARRQIKEGVEALYRWAEEAPVSGVEDGELPRWMRFAIAGFCRAVSTGYISHLVADATTPRGLPLIGRLP